MADLLSSEIMRFSPLALLVTLAAACSSANHTQPPDPTLFFTNPAIRVRDLDAVSELSIGGADERAHYLLHAVVGGALFEDRIAIALSESAELRLYTLDGRLAARHGQKGSGPGEYRSISALRAVGDTAVVLWDRSLRRLSIVGLDGGVRRTIAPELTAALSMTPQFVSMLTTGHIVFSDRRGLMDLHSEATGLRRDSVLYFVLEPPDYRSGQSWWSAGPEELLTNTNGVRGRLPVLFGRTSVHAAGRSSVVVGATDSLAFRRYGPDGLVQGEAAFGWTLVPAGRSAAERERERLAAAVMRELQGVRDVRLSGRPWAAAVAPAAERTLAQLPHRETFPAFSELLIDADDNLWVAEYPQPLATARWWVVLDSKFRPLARTSIPTAMEVLDIRGDRLLVRTRDEWGRESVSLHRLAK